MIKFSVDIIIVSLKDIAEKNIKLLSDNLINHKYSYSNYQTSRFYGLNLLYKLIFDKIFAVLFLLLASPLLVLAMIFIYMEDGFPIFFVEESAGWDGRRFNVHKLRIHRKNSLNKKLLSNIEKVKSEADRHSYDSTSKIHYFPFNERNVLCVVQHFKNSNFDNLVISVPIEEAKFFKEDFSDYNLKFKRANAVLPLIPNCEVTLG